jgi:uncharacterized protein with ParB-like and HNH nuclease domain
MKAVEKNLLKLLSNNDVTFFIPPYQRNYEWATEHCEVLWNDIVNTAEKNKGSDTHNFYKHFFGTVTYFESDHHFDEPAKLVLIDGQQRITSTMLFLLAVRDKIQDVNKKELINKSFLVNTNVLSEDQSKKIKLKQVEADWEAYKSVVNGKINNDYLNSSIIKNYNYFKQQMSKKTDEELNILIDNGLRSFTLVALELEPNNPGENPQEIFESMNSLGKPLSLADLVRNYMLLFMQPAEQETNYNKYWLVIEKNLPGAISSYIRDFMQLHEKRALPVASETNYKKLYAEFKSLYGNRLSSTNVLEAMANYSEIYSWILGLKHVNNKRIDCILEDLRKVKVTTANSFLLSLLISWQENKFSDSDVADILWCFETYILRRRLLLLTQAENKAFPVLTDEIDFLISCSDKKQAMFEILSNKEYRLRLPNDVEITKYLESANLSKFQNTKFYLSLIEEKITKNRPVLDEKIQLEHILPQTLNDDWKNDLGENFEQIHQNNVDVLGNLTLIRHNQELGNKKFSLKKEFYKNKAGLQIAQNFIIDNDFWNEETIQNRTKELSSYLVSEVLPIPEKMRTSNNYNSKEYKGVHFEALDLIGKNIYYLEDPSVEAKVVSDNEVEYDNKKYRLTPVTRLIKNIKGTANTSGAYQGAKYWGYKGESIYSLMLQLDIDSDDIDDIESDED